MDISDFLLSASGGTGIARLARASLSILNENDGVDGGEVPTARAPNRNHDVQLAVRVVLEQLFRKDAGTRMFAFAAAELGRVRERRPFSPGDALFIDLVRAACLSRIGSQVEARAIVDACRDILRPVLAHRWIEIAALGESIDPKVRARVHALLEEVVEMENAFETIAAEACPPSAVAQPSPVTPDPSGRSEPADAHAPHTHIRRLVLLIDDDGDLRESVSLLLEGSGFDVVTARNGAEAVVLLEGGLRPRAILLDLMMPVMNGWDFYEWQRRSPLAATPTVVYTASGLRPGALGPLQIVPKTVPAAALVSAVAAAAR